MKTEILLHTILYNWRDGSDRELNDSDNEHIHYMINQGFNQGELVSYDNDTETDVYGWWEITKD